MKEYTVIIPEMEFTIKAEDESEAEIQAIGLFDWGNVDIEVMEIEKKQNIKINYCTSGYDNYTKYALILNPDIVCEKNYFENLKNEYP